MSCTLPIRFALAFSFAAAIVQPVGAVSSQPAGNARLRDTHWVLKSLEGVATPVQGNAHLVLRASSQQLAGSTGCNRLRGRFTQRGTELALKVVAVARTSCPQGAMQQEERLLQALAKVDSYRIEGQALSLLQGDAVVARFVSQVRPAP